MYDICSKFGVKNPMQSQFAYALGIFIQCMILTCE